MNNRGIIILTATFIVFVIAALGIGYFSLVNNQIETADSIKNTIDAFYCAETGISASVLAVKEEENWSSFQKGDILVPETDFINGSYKVTVLNDPLETRIDLKSTGTSRNFHRIIKVTLRKTDQGNIIKTDWAEI